MKSSHDPFHKTFGIESLMCSCFILSVSLILSKTRLGTIETHYEYHNPLPDSALLRFLKKEAEEEDIALFATYDDAATGWVLS